MVTFHDLAHKAFDEIYATYRHIEILENSTAEHPKGGTIETFNIDPASYDIQEIGQDFRDILTKYCQENEISIDVQDLSNLPNNFSLTSGNEVVFVNLGAVTCFVFIKLKD